MPKDQRVRTRISASGSQVRWIAAVTVSYIVAASIYAISHGNREFVFYIVVMLVLMGCVFALHRRVRLGAALLWSLSAWGLLHMAGGLLHVPDHWPTDNGSVLYNLWLIPGRFKYDQLVHAFGFGITTWLCWQGLSAAIASQSSAPPRPTPGLMVAVCGWWDGLRRPQRSRRIFCNPQHPEDQRRRLHEYRLGSGRQPRRLGDRSGNYPLRGTASR